MPIKKSALKRIRADKKRRIRNLRVISELKSRAKKIELLLKAKLIDQAEKLILELTSKLDKAASKGVIKKRTASRKKGRLLRRLYTSKIKKT
jgi:small subunit ribosomal protein S20